MTVIVKVRQPKTIPYFCAMGRSSRPKAARMSLGEVMEVMVEKAWSSLSRSLSSGGGVLVDAMVAWRAMLQKWGGGGEGERGAEKIGTYFENVPIFDPLLWFSTKRRYQSIQAAASCRETTTTIAPSYSSISSWIQYSEFPIMAEVRRAEEWQLWTGCFRRLNPNYRFWYWHCPWLIFGWQITLARIQVMHLCHRRMNINYFISSSIRFTTLSWLSTKLTFHFLSFTFCNASYVPKQ